MIEVDIYLLGFGIVVFIVFGYALAWWTIARRIDMQSDKEFLELLRLLSNDKQKNKMIAELTRQLNEKTKELIAARKGAGND